MTSPQVCIGILKIYDALNSKMPAHVKAPKRCEWMEARAAGRQHMAAQKDAILHADPELSADYCHHVS
jgi:hypothetical protein